MGTDSHMRTNEDSASSAGRESGDQAHGSGRVGMIQDDGGRALLAEAGALFRSYEAHHAKKGNLDGDVKARRNGEMADRIDAYLAVSDPELQRLGRIWRDVPGTIEERAEDAHPGVAIPRWGEPTHPVDALKEVARGMGFELDPGFEERARHYCDEPVVAITGLGVVEGFTAQGPAFTLTRAPPAEGLEANGHRPDCECAVCWPVVYPPLGPVPTPTAEE